MMTLSTRVALLSVVLAAGCKTMTTPAPESPGEPGPGDPDRMMYKQLSAGIRSAGIEVVDLLRDQKAAGFHERFTPDLATRVPLAEVTRIIGDVGAVPTAFDVGIVTFGGQRLFQAVWPRPGVPGADWFTQVLFTRDDQVADFGIRPFVDAGPAAAEAPPVQALALPVAGHWLVAWGGRNVAANYHRADPGQRFAIDMMIWREGATFGGDGTRKEDYWAWGQPVTAPADGEVVQATNGAPDNLPGDLGRSAGSAQKPFGNHVVIRVASGKFVFLGHLQSGSLKVQTGVTVKLGDALGLCGNSGNTSEPHLHMHVQDGFPGPPARGVPMAFTDVLVDGAPAASAEPEQGSFLQARARTSAAPH